MTLPLWQKVKRTKKPLDENEEESEKAGLKFSVQKAFIIWNFIGKIMSLLFNMLSRFVIAFLPRSMPLFISWAPKSLQMVSVAMKLKDAYSLDGGAW